MSEKMRAGLYIRMSQARGEHKIEQQMAQGQALAAANNAEVVEVYVDDGITGFKFKDRPGWAEMLTDVRARKLDVLLSQTEDRFTRQPMEKELLQIACVDAGVIWITTNDGRVDPATADGEFFSTLRAGLARMESRRKGERQCQANDAHAAKGLPFRGGKRPFGYLEDRMALHPVEAPLIAQAYADLIAGRRTLSRIRTDWNALGVTTVRGNPWDLPKVEKVLRRPKNAGYVQQRGSYDSERRGKWETIVSEADYAAALAILDNPRRRLARVTVAKHLCSSIAKCGACGTSMRVAGKTKGDERVTTYRCGVHDGAAHKQPGIRHTSIRTDELDAIVAEEVCRAVVWASLQAPLDDASARLRKLHKTLSDIRRAELNLLDLVETGAFSAAEVAMKRLDLRTKAEGVEAEITAIGQRSTRAALLNLLVERVIEASDPDGTGEPRVREYLKYDKAGALEVVRARFGLLPLDERRQLVRSMLTVTVGQGRGDDRVNVRHLVATQLNHDPEF